MDEILKGLPGLVEKMGKAAAVPDLLKITHESLPSKTVPILVAKDDSGTPRIVSLHDEIDKYRDAPERINNTTTVTTLDTMIALINRHKDDGSVCFAHVSDNPSVTAIIDYHKTPSVARFCRHRVHYEFPLNKDFVTWRGASGQWMTQKDFANLIDDRVQNLSSATGAELEFEKTFGTKFATPAELLTVSRGLAVRAEQSVKEVNILQSGETQVLFEENHKGMNGGALEVPGLFIVQVPIFDQGDTVRLVARLRYRLVEQSIKWAFYFHDLHNIFAATIRTDLEVIERETSVPVYEGEYE